jgi:hypothetical protein
MVSRQNPQQTGISTPAAGRLRRHTPVRLPKHHESMGSRYPKRPHYTSSSSGHCQKPYRPNPGNYTISTITMSLRGYGPLMRRGGSNAHPIVWSMAFLRNATLLARSIGACNARILSSHASPWQLFHDPNHRCPTPRTQLGGTGG